MAASRSIGGVFATLTLRDLKFRNGMKRAGRSLAKFGKMAIRAGSVATGALAVGLVAGTKKTIAMGAELDHLSTQTGVAVADLMRIQQAYKDNGKAAESAGKDINKMQRAIFEASEDPGGSMDYFAQMGLSAEKLMGMNSTEQFFAIGEAIKGIQNPTKQAALAMDVFGRSGGELLTVFKGSNLDDVNQALGRMPDIMQQYSGELERADTLMGRLPNKANQFFVGFTAGVIDNILPALDSMNERDFTELGENLGDSISAGLDLLTSGKVWDLFLNEAKRAQVLLQNELPQGNWGAALINTVWDGVTDTGQGFDFDEYWNKYYDAGIAANAEVLADLDKERDRIHTEIAESAATKKAKSKEAIEDKGLFELPPEAVAPLIEAIKAEAKDPIDIAGAREEASGGGSDDYLRRGLSLGKSSGEQIQKKQEIYLKGILEVLNLAKTDGKLTWA